MSEKPTVVPGVYKVCEGILINKDNDSLQAYKKRKLKDLKLESLEDDVQALKSDIGEIKEMMRELLQKR
jgi:hypothetical protein